EWHPLRHTVDPALCKKSMLHPAAFERNGLFAPLKQSTSIRSEIESHERPSAPRYPLSRFKHESCGLESRRPHNRACRVAFGRHKAPRAKRLPSNNGGFRLVGCEGS